MSNLYECESCGKILRPSQRAWRLQDGTIVCPSCKRDLSDYDAAEPNT